MIHVIKQINHGTPVGRFDSLIVEAHRCTYAEWPPGRLLGR